MRHKQVFPELTPIDGVEEVSELEPECENLREDVTRPQVQNVRPEQSKREAQPVSHVEQLFTHDSVLSPVFFLASK